MDDCGEEAFGGICAEREGISFWKPLPHFYVHSNNVGPSPGMF